MSARPQPTRRSDYRQFYAIPTRWADNDAYGHVNNVVYYAFFDTAVNRYLVDNGALDIANSTSIGLVVESQCTYFSSMAYPDTANVGLRITRLGGSSVHYEIAVFRNDDEQACAVGRFVHVYVDRATNRPTPIAGVAREVLQRLVA